MKIDLLKHTIVNVVKSVTFGMKKPEKKFFRTIFENMLEHKTTVLSHLGDTQEKTAKEIRNYYTKHLGKSDFYDLGDKVEKIMIKFIGNINPENAFCFDSVDINKNSAKKMECLKPVRDGSEGTFGSGYVFHSVSIKGIPLFLHREELEAKDKDKGLRFEIFEKQLKRIRSVFGIGQCILADRLYDDFKKFKLLIELGFNFSIRAKTNRYVTILEGEYLGEIKKTGDLKEGRYRVKVKGIREDLFMFVRTLKGQEKPIRVISNVDDEKVVEKYLERWEIERIFKTGKQEFDFEKIGTKVIQKTENLVYIVQLCLGIGAYIYDKIEGKYEFEQEKNDVVSLEKMMKKIKPFLREKALKLNRNSITNFISYYMKFIRKMKFYFKVTLKPKLSLQLSLNV